MLQSTITSYLQELLQSYMQSNEEFQELINGSKIDISGLELSADSDKRNVTRLLNKGWLAIEIGEDGIINTIQLRMDIFTMLNSSQYTTRTEILKKLISLTEIYLIDDIGKSYKELATIINDELYDFKCDVIESFIPNHPFYFEFSEIASYMSNISMMDIDIDTILDIGEVLGGKIILTRASEDSYVYKMVFRHARQMEQPYYVETLKEKLEEVFDNEVDPTEGQKAVETTKSLNDLTPTQKIIKDSIKWQETKQRKNRKDMITVVRPS